MKSKIKNAKPRRWPNDLLVCAQALSLLLESGFPNYKSSRWPTITLVALYVAPQTPQNIFEFARTVFILLHTTSQS
jgi:hypothetical protein